MGKNKGENMRLKIERRLFFLKRITSIFNYSSLLYSKEVIYQNLFYKLIEKKSDIDFFPVKAAASYSLLYLIYRTIEEVPVSNVLELGAGESTKLLSSIGSSKKVVTLESDEFWANSLNEQVHSNINVIFSPERVENIRGYESSCYQEDLDGSFFDMIIVDAPKGLKKRSRWCSLKYLSNNLSKEGFVVIFDDVDRLGEMDTVEEFLKLLDTKGVDYQVSFTRARKTQCLISSGDSYRKAHFF